jgi:hypothetical protein
MKKIFFQNIRRPRSVIIFEWLWMLSLIVMFASLFLSGFIVDFNHGRMFDVFGAVILSIFLIAFGVLSVILFAITIYRVRLIYIIIVILSVLSIMFQINLYLKMWMSNIEMYVEFKSYVLELFFFGVFLCEFYLLMSPSFRAWIFKGLNSD